MPHMSKVIDRIRQTFAFLSFSHPCSPKRYIECPIFGALVHTYAHWSVGVGYHALVAGQHQGIRAPSPICQNRLTGFGFFELLTPMWPKTV